MNSNHRTRPASASEMHRCPRTPERHRGRLILFSLVLVAGSIVVSGQSLQDPELTSRIQVLDASIEATVAAEGLPGLSIGLVHDQDLIWAKSYGFANLEKQIPASPATLYRLASVTKVFTATAIMQLRDAGKLHLDDPVAKHLPWFAPKNPFPNSPAITVWHLMTHTGGLPDADGRASTVSTVGEVWREELSRFLRETELVLPPETEYSYENVNYVLLGQIIAAVSGQPYARYMEDHILTPLGMKASRFREEGAAVGYRRTSPGMPYEVAPRPVASYEQSPGAPAGGLYTSVDDLARFASLQFHDGLVKDAQIVRGSTLREMQRVQWLQRGWQSGVGLGWELIERVGEQIRVGHEGGSSGWRADLVTAPTDKLAVIVLVNARGFDTHRIINLAFETGARAVTVVAERSKTVSIPDPRWEKYVGTYAGRRVMVLNGLLTIIDPLAATPWVSRVVLRPVAPHTFRVRRMGSPYGDLDRELATFETDQNGGVIGLRWGTNYWPRR